MEHHSSPSSVVDTPIGPHRPLIPVAEGWSCRRRELPPSSAEARIQRLSQIATLAMDRLLRADKATQTEEGGAHSSSPDLGARTKRTNDSGVPRS